MKLWNSKFVTIIVLQRCVKTGTAAGNGARWTVQDMTTKKQRLVIMFHHPSVFNKGSFQPFFSDKAIYTVANIINHDKYINCVFTPP